MSDTENNDNIDAFECINKDLAWYSFRLLNHLNISSLESSSRTSSGTDSFSIQILSPIPDTFGSESDISMDNSHSFRPRFGGFTLRSDTSMSESNVFRSASGIFVAEDSNMTEPYTSTSQSGSFETSSGPFMIEDLSRSISIDFPTDNSFKAELETIPQTKSITPEVSFKEGFNHVVAKHTCQAASQPFRPHSELNSSNSDLSPKRRSCRRLSTSSSSSESFIINPLSDSSLSSLLSNLKSTPSPPSTRQNSPTTDISSTSSSSTSTLSTLSSPSTPSSIETGSEWFSFNSFSTSGSASSLNYHFSIAA